jgi:biotin carboxylase
VEADSPDGGKRLLVLGAGPAQLGALAAARRRGAYVIAVDRNPAAPGFRHADRRAILSAEDERGITRLARAERVDGLIAPGIDWPVAIAARVADGMGLPHPISPETALLATSKARQRERFAEAGIPQARAQIVRTPDEARGAAKRVGLPCVLKPADRQGQVGLAVVDRLEDLGPYFAEAAAAARGGAVLVEELVPGREITVNAFSVGGTFNALTATDRMTAEPPAFGVAVAHAWPSHLAPDDVDAAIAAARAGVEALGIEAGPSYTQVLAAPDGPRVVEVAARLGGGHDAELCHAALGVDLNGLALQAALGEPIWSAALRAEPQVEGAVARFLVPPEGVLQEVEGVEEARAVEGVQDVRIYREPGHVFGPFLRGADRAGAVLATGDSREEALERADEAAGLIRFKVGAESLV